MSSTKIFMVIIMSTLFGCEPTPVRIDDRSEHYAHIEYLDYGFVKYKGKPYTGVIVTHYGDGTERTFKRYESGERTGNWYTYYPNGQMHIEGLGSGVYTEYYENGNAKETKFKMIDENIGEVLKHHKAWYENGWTEFKRHYNMDGDYHGRQFYYYEDGTLRTESDWKNGVEVSTKEYWPNGQLQYSCYYENGLKEGFELFYYDNGQLKRKQEFRQGYTRMDYIDECYFPDGTRATPYQILHLESD